MGAGSSVGGAEGGGKRGAGGDGDDDGRVRGRGPNAPADEPQSRAAAAQIGGEDVPAGAAISRSRRGAKGFLYRSSSQNSTEAMRSKQTIPLMITDGSTSNIKMKRSATLHKGDGTFKGDLTVNEYASTGTSLLKHDGTFTGDRTVDQATITGGGGVGWGGRKICCVFVFFF